MIIKYLKIRWIGRYIHHIDCWPSCLSFFIVLKVNRTTLTIFNYFSIIVSLFVFGIAYGKRSIYTLYVTIHIIRRVMRITYSKKMMFFTFPATLRGKCWRINYQPRRHSCMDGPEHLILPLSAIRLSNGKRIAIRWHSVRWKRIKRFAIVKESSIPVWKYVEKNAAGFEQV